MLQWVVVTAEQRDLVVRALPKAWRGGAAAVADVVVPLKKAPRALAVAWSEGAAPRREPRWPEVLADWVDIYDEPLFPAPGVPVLAEEASALGADAVAIHAEPGLALATVAWYEKGALRSYEHVGGATVAWDPAGGLGRPFDGSTRSLIALGGKKLANAVGSERNAEVFDRIEKTNRAVGETLVLRAFLQLLDADPPPWEELAALVARSPQFRVSPG